MTQTRMSTYRPLPARRAGLSLERLDNLVGDPAASEAASLRLYEVPSTVV